MSPVTVVASFWSEVANAYEEAIVDAGKEPELFTLLAFLLTFGFIRTSTHLIRRGVKWWPGNVEVGGTHIHHLVWGILLLLVVGYVGVAVEPASPWQEILAILFGIGAALTLDEFALWLNLRDVYWSAEGRRSIDAVIVASILGALMVIGFGVWVNLAEDARLLAQLVIGTVGAFGLVMALINALKGKFGMAVLSLLVPVAGAVGAVRMARPDSLWARLYSEKRRGRAEERFAENRRLGRSARRDDAALPPEKDQREQPGELSRGGAEQRDRDREQERA